MTQKIQQKNTKGTNMLPRQGNIHHIITHTVRQAASIFDLRCHLKFPVKAFLVTPGVHNFFFNIYTPRVVS